MQLLSIVTQCARRLNERENCCRTFYQIDPGGDCYRVPLLSNASQNIIYFICHSRGCCPPPWHPAGHRHSVLESYVYCTRCKSLIANWNQVLDRGVLRVLENWKKSLKIKSKVKCKSLRLLVTPIEEKCRRKCHPGIPTTNDSFSVDRNLSTVSRHFSMVSRNLSIVD